MAAKTRKDAIYVVYEGYREEYFLEHLSGFSTVHLNLAPCYGGNANEIVAKGKSISARDVNVYIFFDEDFEKMSGYKISDETFAGLETAWRINTPLKELAYRDLQKMNKDMRNPILIVSYPKSIEGFILRLLNEPLQVLERKTTQELKERISNLLVNIQPRNEDIIKMDNYDRKIAKYKQEIAGLRQSEPNYKERRRFLGEKTKECERNKNKVKFMRFLNDKLPLPKLAAKRAGIPEVDVLLKAFGM